MLYSLKFLVTHQLRFQAACGAMQPEKDMWWRMVFDALDKGAVNADGVHLQRIWPQVAVQVVAEEEAAFGSRVLLNAPLHATVGLPLVQIQA